MRALLLLREAWATAWASKVPSILVLFLVAGMCAATLATVGRTAAAEEQLAERLDAAGSRVLVVSDLGNERLISSTIVDQIAGLSTTERSVGIVNPIDVVNGPIGQGGDRIPAWGVYGDLSAAVTLTSGRWPGPGEAVVTDDSMDALGMDDPVGWVARASTSVVEDWSVVGSFSPREPFGDYGSGVVYMVPSGQALDSVHVVLTSSEVAPTAQSQVMRLIDPPTPDQVNVISPVSLAQLTEQVASDFASFGRSLLLAVVGGGALLIAIIVLADVLVRRRDIGRRRALGSTRGAIVALVVLRTLVPALVGVVLGLGLGLWVTSRLGTGTLPPADFSTGTAILALLAAVAAAVPPAFYAATRDPVRVLRTP